jgi:FAD:protein FMN transferase
MQRRTFRAMGTDIELHVDADNSDTALRAAETEFHRLEALLSRFRNDSELSRLNRAGTLEASPDVVRLTELALEARAATGGRFDPTVHDALHAVGYAASFELVPRDSREPAAAAACDGRVRVSGRRILLDDGVRLDFGGIAKGYAADRAASILATAGPCLVNAGGDIAIRGGRWPVGVATSSGSITLELSEGALATTGRDRRIWRRAGRTLHHVIDPATGTSATGDLLRVTVVAADAVQAETWAKALFLAGSGRACGEANALGLPCVLVTLDGTTRLAGGLA